MTGDKACRCTDLLLAVKGVEQSSADLLGRDRQVIERLAAFAGQRCWRYIQISGEIERHCAVEEAARGFDGLGCPATDPLERLIDGVRVGEDVVRGFPIRVLIGGAEARNPEGCCISKRSTEIGGGCPTPRCSCERRYDSGGIVAEKALGTMSRDPTSPSRCRRP